jgi:hypothetical protein
MAKMVVVQDEYDLEDDEVDFDDEVQVSDDLVDEVLVEDDHHDHDKK